MQVVCLQTTSHDGDDDGDDDDDDDDGEETPLANE